MAETTHTEAEAQGHGDHGGHGHHDPKEHEKHYWKIYWILLALLIASVIGPFVGEATDLLIITLITAFGIAFVKAYLVVKNFMHIGQEPKYIGYLCATALVLMALLFFWVAPDVMKHEGNNWVNLSAMAATGEAPAVHAGTFDAEETYQSVCASCHGAEGKGDGVAAAGLDPKPAAFTTAEFWAERDRERIEKVIREGGPAVGASPLMAAFGASYTDEQLTQLVDYLETFRPDDVVVQEPRVDVEAGEQPWEGEEPAEGEQPAEGEEVVAEGEQPAEGEEPAEGEQPTEGEQVAAAPAEPAGPSEAQKAAHADFITDRLYR